MAARRGDGCRFEGCDRQHYGHGWCSPHYQQWYKTGKVKPLRVRGTEKPCAGPACDRKAICKGFCNSHYWQHRRGLELRPLFETQRMPGALAVRDERGCKECAACREWWPEDHFGASPKNTDGLRSECRACRSAYYSRNRDKLRAASILRKFNITIEQYDAMLAAHGGGCAICQRTPDQFAKSFAVDHDHNCCPGAGSCGKCVRGILCPSCNTALGSLGDNPETLLRAASYLENASCAR